MWRRPTIRVLAALVGVGLGGLGEEAAPQSLQMDVTGVGVLTIQDRQIPIKSVTYATLAESRRTSYSASLPHQTLTFAGGQDAWTDLTHYTLTLDSVVSLTAEGVKDMPATGTCRMEISPDATVVRLVLCEATTETGSYSLRFQLSD